MSEQEQFVKDWYAKLCANARQAQLNLPETRCVHCGRPRKEHHYDDLRCTLYVTSTGYLAVNHDEVVKTSRTLAALEGLAEVCGWSLP